ncbi:MAG: TIR domain-containing protein [Anaerolineae bacterium]|nr:TIR domain-containing protein [Anaerolineae bacterium]
MTRAFISYSRRNTNFAERLARDLSDAGVEVWIDFRQIHAGELWKEEIRNGIERSEVLVLVVSPDAVTSEWVRYEIDHARAHKKIILPVMAVDAMAQLQGVESLRWLLDIHFIKFDGRYEQAFPELLRALPGKRRVGAFDSVDPASIPNPFKGLEAFQQTDSAFFFGREQMIKKALNVLKPGRPKRFLAVVGGSGSGKSSLVRAGVIPQLRAGAFAGSETWRVAIFTPGEHPTRALATRLAPFFGDETDAEALLNVLESSQTALSDLASQLLAGAPDSARLLLVVDQFEEAFTRAQEPQTAQFIDLVRAASIDPNGRVVVVATLRADFFDRLGRYPTFAELFEGDHLLLVSEMTPANLLRAITGPADAVGLLYEDGLPDRILEDVRRQPGSLPLLQYALKELYARRDGRRLTHAVYDAIGGVAQALARHAEGIYSKLKGGQQDIVRRVLLRLVEISEDGVATRRRVARPDLTFVGTSNQTVSEVVELLTAPESRLLVASREIRAHADQTAEATVWLEVGHEALIREWDRLKGWISDDFENLRLGADLLRAAGDWLAAKRDRAYLMSGTRLSRAEEWLGHADASALQREYVRASVDERERLEDIAEQQAQRELALQKSAAARLRGFVALLVLALFVTAGLVVFAFQERDRAEQNARIAEENARIADENRQEAVNNLGQANSFALAALADRALGDGENDLAVALAVESSVIVAPAPPQSRLTLAQVAFAPGTRRVMTPSGVDMFDADLSGDGAFAVSVGESVTYWRVSDGSAVAQMPESLSDGTPVNAEYRSAALSPVAALVAVGLSDGGVVLWSPEDGEARRMFGGHAGAVLGVAFDSLGERVVSAGADGQVIVWGIDGQPISFIVDAHLTEVTGAQFWPVDEGVIVSAGRDGRIVQWDATSGQNLRVITTATPHLDLDLSLDGRLAATGGTGGAVMVWELSDGLPTGTSSTRPIREQQGGGANDSVQASLPLFTYPGHATDAVVQAVALSPDATQIASAGTDGLVFVWDVLLAGSPVLTFDVPNEAELVSLAFSADGRRLLSGGATDDAAVLRVWDVVESSMVRDFVGHLSRPVVQFLPGEALAVSAGAVNRGGAQQANVLWVWDVMSGRIVQELSGHTGSITALDVSADGRRVVSVSADRTVRVWDIGTGVGQLVGTTGTALTSVVWLPDDRTVISAGRDGQIRVWDTQDLRLMRSFIVTGQAPPVIQAIVLGADGQTLYSGGAERRVRVWDVASGQQRRTIEIDDRGIQSLAVDALGTRVAVGTTGGRVAIYGTADGALVQRLAGHAQNVLSVSFSPDGQTLLSTGVDGTLRVWDLETSFEIRRYTMPDPSFEGIQTAVVSTDAQTVLTALRDGRLRLWRLYPSLDSLLAWTFANRYVRDLTCAERDAFRLFPCDASGVSPLRDAPDLPTLNALPLSTLLLGEGVQAEINTLNGLSQRLRVAPGAMTNADILTNLPDGSIVTLTGQTREAVGFRWWEVETESGRVGWVVEYDPNDGVQALVPVEAIP